MMNKNSNSQFIIEDIWKNILNGSKEQSFIKAEIMLKTIKYMIEEMEEDNTELIQFVSSLIQKPSTNKKLNLNDKNRKDFSQEGQSGYIDSILNQKKNGFFIEAGGYNGEEYSNSLFFELERNWTGLLIEPVPSLYQQILSKNRNIYSINACIASKKPLIAKIRGHGTLAGRESEMTDFHINWVVSAGQYSIFYVPCFSLNTIFKAIGLNKIDMFSLDIEGDELDVIKSIDFKNIYIKSFVIEHNNEIEKKQKILEILKSNNYNFTKDGKLDIMLVKND